MIGDVLNPSEVSSSAAWLDNPPGVDDKKAINEEGTEYSAASESNRMHTVVSNSENSAQQLE